MELGVVRIKEGEEAPLSLVLGSADEWGETKGPVIICAPDKVLDTVQRIGMESLFVDMIPMPEVQLPESIEIDWKGWTGTVSDQIKEALEREQETSGLYQL